MKHFIIDIIQIILSILLVIVILLQSRGSGLSGTFGGGGEVYRTKRGIEKFLLISTIIIAILFFIVAIINVLLG